MADDGRIKMFTYAYARVLVSDHMTKHNHNPHPQATPRFYLAALAVEIFLHGCEIKSGSGLGTRLT